MPGGPRGALVDEVNGDSICDQIPLPHGHGSVNFRFSMIPSSLKFQVSSAPSHAGSFRKKLFPPGRVLPIHGSLKRKRGVGERHKSSRVGACCTSGLLVHAPRCTPTPRSRFRLPVRCQGPKNWPTTGLSFRSESSICCQILEKVSKAQDGLPDAQSAEDRPDRGLI